MNRSRTVFTPQVSRTNVDAQIVLPNSIPIVHPQPFILNDFLVSPEVLIALKKTIEDYPLSRATGQNGIEVNEMPLQNLMSTQ